MTDSIFAYPLPAPADLGVVDKRWSFKDRLEQLAIAAGSTLPPHCLRMADKSSNWKPNISAVTTPTCTLDKRKTSKVLIVPGLLADSVAKLVTPFMKASVQLTLDGYQLEIAWVNGRRGCKHNAKVLRDKVMDTSSQHGGAVHVIGYSKGCADAMHMLTDFPETHACVKSLTSFAGVVHGTPLADNTSRLTRKLLQYLPIPGVAYGDGRAVHDLTTSYRSRWLEQNPLPKSVAYFSMAAAAERSAVSRILRRSYDQLSEHDPMNDSQVIWRDSILPESELLAVVNADHWAVALPLVAPGGGLTNILLHQNMFPRELVLRAVLDHVIETAAAIHG